MRLSRLNTRATIRGLAHISAHVTPEPTGTLVPDVPRTVAQRRGTQGVTNP